MFPAGNQQRDINASSSDSLDAEDVNIVLNFYMLSNSYKQKAIETAEAAAEVEKEVEGTKKGTGNSVTGVHALFFVYVVIKFLYFLID